MLKSVNITKLPKILDERGNLSFFESEKHIPFVIKRTYWIYDVPGGEIRGGHSYLQNEEIIIALSGSFDVVVNDGRNIKKYTLNRSYDALYMPNNIWRHFENFSTNSLAFIASSTIYNENDYVRDFDVYVQKKYES